MPHSCEVCESIRPDGTFGPNYRVIDVPFDVRTVRLCVGHARIAENSQATTFEALRELFGQGRRSFVPRRAPQASGAQQRSAGRRATDGQPTR